MSPTTRWAFVYASFVVACATGGHSGDDDGEQQDAAVTHDDANMVVTPDAKVKLDAGVIVHDAFVMPDSPPSSLFCSSNNQCTTVGQCCFTLGQPTGFCVTGTVVLGQCVPQ